TRMSEAQARGTTISTVGGLSVSEIWGSTFFLIKDLVGRLPAADFLAVRFAIAAAAMVMLFFRPLLRLTAREWWQGLLLGVVYGIGQLLQTNGLEHTDASISGFATGMYVVFTPLLGTVLLRQPLPSVPWVGVRFGVGGLAVLGLRGRTVGYGVWVSLASAVLYGLHIVGLGQW